MPPFVVHTKCSFNVPLNSASHFGFIETDNISCKQALFNCANNKNYFLFFHVKSKPQIYVEKQKNSDLAVVTIFTYQTTLYHNNPTICDPKSVFT